MIDIAVMYWRLQVIKLKLKFSLMILFLMNDIKSIVQEGMRSIYRIEFNKLYIDRTEMYRNVFFLI